MIGLKIIQTARPPSWQNIVKQIEFGTAVGLTQTAKDGQKASQDALRGTFIIRNKWPEIGPYAIKIKPATKNDLASEVRTAADWLVAHETGEDKKAKSGDVAVPTDQVRRNKRLIIPRGQRPRGLGDKVFVLKTKHGPVLAQRISRGKRKGLIVLYGLEKSVRIRKQSTFYAPIQAVVKRNLDRNIKAGIERALATAK
jgi:hypothetical protein